jgi:protein TonB
MNTMTLSSGDAGFLSELWQEKRGQLGKMAVIVGVHAVLFYGLQSSMVHEAVQKLPQVVDVTFVTPVEPPPPAPPKMLEVAPTPPAIVTPVLPVLPIQIENTITPPPPAPVQKTVEPVPVTVSAPAPAAPPVQAAPAGPRVVSAVEYIRPPQPVYPAISRRMGESGVVTLRVLISEKGLPEKAVVQTSSGSQNLDEAGRQAALRTLFKPYIEDGKPVPVYVLVPINFRLS